MKKTSLGLLFLLIAVLSGCYAYQGSSTRSSYTPSPVTKQNNIASKDLRISFTPDYSGYSGKYMEIEGSVTNDGNVAYSFIKAKANAIRVSDGSVVNSNWMYIIDSMPLDPGERRLFSIMIEVPNATPQNRRYEIKLVE